MAAELEGEEEPSTVPRPAGTAAGPSKPESFLLIFNVSKKQNFGTLLRSACAFGVTEVLVVGAKKIATFGNQGTVAHANVRHFETLQAAKAELSSRGARICGIEIDERAESVTKHPFTGSTAFMLGNEGEGMSAAQRAACDFFVYIPQHTGATASLNVAIAGSIVLHHFATWAQMAEHPRQGEKYLVDLEEARPTDEATGATRSMAQLLSTVSIFPTDSADLGGEKMFITGR
ncbi:unnamed protein product [Durusdinium trenchii]|uniref:tRNA/rRNA methyltransferase SpoU type domain-containing protein n=1 Tax=Durusdinium trenchii TaxID=1381693 RepID=A0ABP0M5Y7_9DINO